MPAPGEGRGSPPAKDGDERLSVRQAIFIWLAAAVLGWLATMSAVYLATRVL